MRVGAPLLLSVILSYTFIGLSATYRTEMSAKLRMKVLYSSQIDTETSSAAMWEPNKAAQQSNNSPDKQIRRINLINSRVPPKWA